MSVLDAFPTRPLRASRIGISRLTGCFVVLVGFAFAGGIGWWQAEDLWRDYKISRNYEIADDARISNGECKTRKLIFTDCSATIIAADGARNRVEMMFVDMHAGGYETGVVRSREDPRLLTLELGVEKITDRILTFLAFVGGFAVLGIAGLAMLFKASRLRRAVAKPVVMRPVVAKVLTQTRTWLNHTIKYEYSLDGKTRKATSILKKNEIPFFLDTEERQVLAVVPQTTSTPILLDAGLETLDLTDEERAAVHAAISPVQDDIRLDRSMRW
ncbi:hypothetical protein FZC33_13925 [Labrys sp. KNU-23]|uniref:hypothetical protein n=1 Tax=Labrys sp. KNU-23 TaxID=2789216 RepID=UPI0011EE1B82|nr:hypothetical protein [Labrys sp. KNU-23]QEN87357.1 hypothetical protein FZC33_13925 [Labrys sp. KNU-23]